MLRTLAKTALANGMHWSSIDRLVGARSGLKTMPLVVGYHRVVEDFEDSATRSIPSMLVSVKTFERHLDWIGRRYDFVSLDDLGRIIKGGKAATRPVAAVTFDDGYADVYRNAFPILKRKGIPSASFVVTDHIGTKRLHVHDELYFLLKGALSQLAPDKVANFLVQLHSSARKLSTLYPATRDLADPYNLTRFFFESLSQEELQDVIVELRERVDVPESLKREFYSLNWRMLKEMVLQGMTIGAHTRSHSLLVNEGQDKVRDEINGSKLELEKHLKKKITHFAYPDGKFNNDTLAEVAAAGFRNAYTICMHRDHKHPSLTIGRRMLWENSCTDSFGRFSPAILSCQVNGIFDPALKCTQQHAL